MRVINYDGVNVVVLDTDDTRLEHGAEDVFKPQEILEYFGIDLKGYTSIVYEPERKLYMVEKDGINTSFDSPEDEPVLRAIKEQEDEMIDYLVLRHLRKNIPSKYHRIENYKIVLPKKYQEQYNKEQAEKDAWEYLNDTAWYVTRFNEIGTHIPDGIQEKRKEAYALVSDGFVAKKTRTNQTKPADKQYDPNGLKDKLDTQLKND